jgi:NADPH2:quinone reductase
MRVMGEMHTGGYAEFAKTSEHQVLVLPDGASDLQGLVYFANLRVAYMVYYVFGKVQPQDTILVHAASGGIGSLITQIAKRRNSNVVIALGETDEKLEFCRANGADYTINTERADYVQEVLKVTNGAGVDVSLNSIGGPTLETDPYAIKPTGRWVIYGYAGGKGLIDPYKHALRSLSITACSIYTYALREEWRQAMEFLENWLNTEKDLLSVTRTFPIDEVIKAHHWIEDQHSVGKIALVMKE